MQQVNSIGFRLGSTGWQKNVSDSVNNEISQELQSTVRKARAKRGSFLINSYYYYHRNVLFCPMLYYRYNQRSRLKKWLVSYLNKRQGMMAPPKVRYFVLNKNNVDSFKSVSKRQKNRQRIFPKAELKTKNNKSKRSQSIRGWLDLELNVYGVMSRRYAENIQWQLRELTANLIPRAEFRAYNVFDFINVINPMKGLQNYVMKRFSKMMYNSDVFTAMCVSTQMNMSNLFAHSVQIGLERHAGKREQRRFLMMVRVMSERMLLWKNIDNRLLWRLSIFGKLDAKMRRVHFRLRVGFVRYQEVDFLTNYTNATARTKFGTSSVRVWMRNLLS